MELMLPATPYISPDEHASWNKISQVGGPSQERTAQWLWGGALETDSEG